MPRSMFTEQHRVFMYDNYVKTESCREVVRQFRTQFPDVSPQIETPFDDLQTNLENIVIVLEVYLQ